MGLIVQTSLSTGWGGLEMVLCEFHAWLSKKGISSKVLCLQGSPLESHLQSLGFQSDTLPVPRSWNQLWKAHQILRQLDSPSTGFLFHRQQGPKILGGRSFQSRKVVLCHTFSNSNKRDWLHRLLFSKVDQWITLTSRQKDNLLQTTSLQSHQIKVIPNGVNLNRFTPRLSSQRVRENEFHIGVVARLDPQKGQDLALQALALLQQAGCKKIFLHLIGENTPDNAAWKPHLKKLISQWNLQDHVIFEGHQPQVEKWIHQMDLIWMPSIKETFGRCILEAMACATPIIASNAGGVPDIISDGDNGLLFETQNPADLVRRTRELFQQDQKREKMVRQALQDVRTKYDSELIWSSLLETMQPTGS